jgi:carbon storage regulator
MLVLSRKADQTVVIDGNIRVTILQIKGNVARLGIEAPKDVSVLRSELTRSGVHDSKAEERRSRSLCDPRLFAEMRSVI